MYAIRNILIASLLLPMFNAMAQDCFYERNVHEAGVIFGATYYMGDFNPNRTPFFYPSFYGGAMYRYNFQKYFALRGQAGYGYIRGSGENMEGIPSDPIGNNWRFNRPWLFVDVLAEFNFLPYYAADIRKKQRFTPVLMIGIGGSYLSGNHGDDYIPHSQRGSSSLLDLPIGVGIKWCFIQRFTIGVDWMWRLTLYDQIDYYSTINPKHGNPIKNDWIGTVGLTLSYLFKENLPCPALKKHEPSQWKYDGINTEYGKKSKKKQQSSKGLFKK
ncbi:MAG: DUF6089 family protein [Prevotellaceae bacterium]|jgi:hypothetical protein|nr:DUF6089 family protein [Prevotellaceae bacterium]